MFCIVSSGKNHHNLDYHWFKDGHKFRNVGEKHTIKSEQAHSILKLTNITISDSGNYTCRADNPFGHDSVTAYLTVLGRYC